MRRALAALATVASILASASDAGAHARLVASSPRAGSRLAASPPAIELWFDEVLDAGFHEVTVVSAGAPSTGAASRARAVAVDPNDGTHLVAPIEPLGDGAWVVLWRVLSRDGHGARGRFEFRVAPAPGGDR